MLPIEMKKNLGEGEARGFQEKMLTANVTQLTQLTKSVYWNCQYLQSWNLLINIMLISTQNNTCWKIASFLFGKSLSFSTHRGFEI